MKQARRLALCTFLAAVLLAADAAGQGALRARDILPEEGLVASSVAVIRDQDALDAHYFLADEAALGLGPGTDAVFARYRAGADEALLLVAVHPSVEAVDRVYERFGRDFFSGDFDPRAPRFSERIETGDWAGAAKRGPVLVVVLEAPDRAACDALLDRAAENIPVAKSP
jgi:hypothetical protein